MGDDGDANLGTKRIGLSATGLRSGNQGLCDDLQRRLLEPDVTRPEIGQNAGLE
jgi:hypothetical protein